MGNIKTFVVAVPYESSSIKSYQEEIQYTGGSIVSTPYVLFFEEDDDVVDADRRLACYLANQDLRYYKLLINGYIYKGCIPFTSVPFFMNIYPITPLTTEKIQEARNEVYSDYIIPLNFPNLQDEINLSGGGKNYYNLYWKFSPESEDLASFATTINDTLQLPTIFGGKNGSPFYNNYLDCGGFVIDKKYNDLELNNAPKQDQIWFPQSYNPNVLGRVFYKNTEWFFEYTNTNFASRNEITSNAEIDPEPTNKLPWVIFFSVGEKFLRTLNNPDDAEKYIETGKFPSEEKDDENGSEDATNDNNVNDDTEDTPVNNPSTTPIKSSTTNWYKVTSENLNDLIKFFWTVTDDWSTLIYNQITGLYSNLSECMIQLKYFPISIETSTEVPIVIGRFTSDINAGVIPSDIGLAYEAKISYDELKSKMHQNFLDTKPYTNMFIYLPYIGVVNYDIDLFINRSLGVRYLVDITTGIATVNLYVITNNKWSLVTTKEAQLGVDIPFALTDTLQVVKNSIDSVLSIAGSATMLGSGIKNGSAIGTAIGIESLASSFSNDISDSIDLSGKTSSANNLFQFQKPYVILETVNTSYPDNYGTHIGYVCNGKYKLNNLSGFTTCINPKITFKNGIPTLNEIEEIYSELQKGVIL